MIGLNLGKKIYGSMKAGAKMVDEKGYVKTIDAGLDRARNSRLANSRPVKATTRSIKADVASKAQLTQRAGRSAGNVFNSAPRVSRGVGGAALAGLGAVSFAAGLNQDKQISGSIYGLATGVPDYDQYVLGGSLTRARMGVPTGRMFADAHRAAGNRRSGKNAPTVDGSIAFGMYNARLG